ncbi:hypothetical protein GSI_02721 [Ganoderma sinense ZZ0214-1]|uniref:DUF6534 domain-containing protein n=1 Tax=Ganoderma sinense ZZ0214-1 TaxID=1077348 RepID=A0A2G8SMD5_9APHY|nr:hypothetical protein GSI_02721 [Ganoderma sinense ZZ0214-1]
MDSDAAAAAAAEAALISALKEALSCLVLGTIFATCVYGVSILQVYIYFRKCREDATHFAMRSFVAILFILDTISLALTVQVLYEYTVTDFGQPMLLLNVPRSLVFFQVISVLIACLVQLFFAHRIWALSKHNYLLVGSIFVLALCSFGPGLALSIRLWDHANITYFAMLSTRILGGIASGLSVLCDIIIVLALCYYLHSKRTGFKRTDTMIDHLIVYAINRGILTAICQTGHMVSIAAYPSHSYFFVFGLLESKLYINTLLATLNAQKAMRREGTNIVELGTQILDRISGNTPVTSRTGNHLRSSDGRHDDTSESFVFDLSHDKARTHSDMGHKV